MPGPGLHQHPRGVGGQGHGEWLACYLCICLLCALLTLHRLDKVLDGVGPDTEGRTLLHELGWDMAVGIQVVYCLRVELHGVHELTREGDKMDGCWAASIPST